MMTKQQLLNEIEEVESNYEGWRDEWREHQEDRYYNNMRKWNGILVYLKELLETYYD